MKQRWGDTAYEAGCDEAGRGCLAGPVVAAAVILPENYLLDQLNDSKKLTEKKRDVLAIQIKEQAVAWAIGIIDNAGIDSLNILKASIMAMHKALDQLKVRPTYILVDGNRFIPYPQIPHQCIVKGDSKFAAIAAASILAKTTRDEIMYNLDKEHPQYGWKQNKGYPTVAHRTAIQQFGITGYHRKTFRLFSTQLKLDL